MDNLSGVFARNCSVRRIDKAASDSFLNAYHRLGATGGRYRYGLFVERSTGAAEASLTAGSLVAVAVFSNARRWVKDGRRVSSYEWIRYASLPGIRVVGGMGKLLHELCRHRVSRRRRGLRPPGLHSGRHRGALRPPQHQIPPEARTLAGDFVHDSAYLLVFVAP